MPHIFEISSGLGAQNHLATVTIVGGACRESRSTCGINVTGENDLDDRIDECPPCFNDINISGLDLSDITVNVTGAGGDPLFFEEACA